MRRPRGPRPAPLCRERAAGRTSAVAAGHGVDGAPSRRDDRSGKRFPSVAGGGAVAVACLAKAITGGNTMADRIRDLIGQMTLEEKASLGSGLDLWHTKPVERLGIPSIMMADGPHGLRKQTQSAQFAPASVPSTCFPSGSALASSWDRDLIEAVGRALGEECLAEDVQILLGPGVNIKRSPLCGRNFEYLSEDPYLASELGTHHVIGVQSQGVGTSVKHFACNNQETLRNSIDAVVDERTLFELYLPNFEGPVRRGGAWTVMSAYNQVNGEFCSENAFLLTEVLRRRWGFEGIVMTDWGGVNVRTCGLEAGLDLEMPYIGPEHDQEIVDAVRAGRLAEEVLDRSVQRLLRIILRGDAARRPGFTYSPEAHHALARRTAAECIVLAKNRDGVLPLAREGAVAVLGAFAQRPRYQGGGSSHVHPTRLDVPLDELTRALGAGARVEYADGYALDTDEPDEARLRQALSVARRSDVAVVYAGLPESYESEGFDRSHLAMPPAHVRLIEEVARVQPRLVVVVMNGAPVEMPWLDRAAAVVLCHLGGQAAGGAAADVLVGDVNPSGKLAETYPVRLAQTPAFVNFPGGSGEVRYGEGLFVGYRYYDAKGEAPLFPFGHGLSYTTFTYRDIAVDRTEMTDTDRLRVTVRVQNTGARAGREIVQLYVRDPESSVVRPVKELKGFAKVALEPNESKRVTFDLDRRAFAFFHIGIHDWFVESGEFEILVGPSSVDTPLSARVRVRGTTRPFRAVDRKTKLFELLDQPETADEAARVIAEQLERLQAAAAVAIEAGSERRADAMPRLEEMRRRMLQADLRALAGLMVRMSERDLRALIDRLNTRLGV